MTMNRRDFECVSVFLKIFFFVSSCLSIAELNGQSIEVLYGMEYFYGKWDQGRADLNVTHFTNDDPHIKLRFGLSPLDDDKINFYVSYHQLFPVASIIAGTSEEFNSDFQGSVPWLNGGTGKTMIYRLGIGVGYRFDFWNSRIRTIPKLIINNEIAKETWGPGYGRAGISGRYVYQFYSYSNPGFQMIPEFVVPLCVKLFKGLHLQLEYSFLWGHRPFMYIVAEYEIDGIRQPDSRFYNDGTAHHVMFGLSYMF